MVADTVMDEQVRALSVSMAQTWTKLAQSEVPPLLALRPLSGGRPDNICSLRDLRVLTDAVEKGILPGSARLIQGQEQTRNLDSKIRLPDSFVSISNFTVPLRILF
jgi:hypothetical protein